MSLPEFSQVHGLASSTCVRHLYQAPYEERTDRVLHLSPRLMTQSSSRTRALLTLEQNTCQYLPTLPDSWPCLMCLLVTCWVSQLQVQLDKLIRFTGFFFSYYGHYRTLILYIFPFNLAPPPPFFLFSVYINLFNLNPCIPRKRAVWFP